MPDILLVDDDRIITRVLPKLISRNLSLSVITAESLKDLEKILEKEVIKLAICDYHLPDAEHGEAIDFLLQRQIPTIVLTGTHDEKVRENILMKGAVDYINKASPNVKEEILIVLKRTLKNMETTVLVVEDSLIDLKIISKMLKNALFKVIEARSAQEAYQALEAHKDIKLLILDYYLPDEEALNIIYKIRNKHSKENMAIIVISASLRDKSIPILLKAGANDFLKKPFSQEEFIVRINNTLYLLDLIQELKNSAYRDYLTGLYNRRYFFEEAPKLLNIAKRQNLNLACLLFDLDHFKQINDQYGHEVGDQVLKDFANKLKRYFKRKEDLVARLGGEEFVTLTFYEDKEQFIQFIETFREFISSTPVIISNTPIRYTVSIGCELEKKDTLRNLLKSADNKLYTAKKQGRNRVIF